MRRSSVAVVAAFAGALVFGLPALSAADILKVGLGVNVGGAFITQDLDDDLEADPGLVVNVSGRVGVTDMLVAGVGVEWENHDVVNADDADVAEIDTLTVLPFVELHFDLAMVSPYIVVGLGYNINSVDEGGDCTACDLDIDNTVAVKVGGGVDVELSDSFAVNAEVAWKLNSGELQGSAPDAVSDAKANGATATIGIRWYFL